MLLTYTIALFFDDIRTLNVMTSPPVNPQDVSPLPPKLVVVQVFALLYSEVVLPHCVPLGRYNDKFTDPSDVLEPRAVAWIVESLAKLLNVGGNW